MITAEEALKRLKDGNQRFASGNTDSEALRSNSRRAELVAGQEPFAIILGCSDSRVPAELVFDQGIGDLFVVRVAGNIAAPSQVASVEFCAEQFKTKLVVVLGHTNCGAVSATLNEIRNPSGELSDNLQSVVNKIQPSVETLLDTDLVDKPKDLLTAAGQANVRACVSYLQNDSSVLSQLAVNNGLQVIGAEYSLETGKVEFFDSNS